MTVEELIEELKKMPPHYEFRAYHQTEKTEFVADITFLERQPNIKQVDLVIKKAPQWP